MKPLPAPVRRPGGTPATLEVGPMDWDARVRQAAFDFLDRQIQLQGEVLARDGLIRGFELEGRRVGLMSPQQGIFKPACLSTMPISICTTPPKPGRPAPYEDKMTGELLFYAYRGSDPGHRDNVGLREAWRRQAPLIYFYGVLPGKYLPVYPVFVQGDNPEALQFVISVDDRRILGMPGDPIAAEGRRAYLTVVTLRRLHQVSFRQRVLRAYQSCCAICRLRHVELLDAAHIIPDNDPMGQPVVNNGLALCKLHHAAFDRPFLGIRPDLIVELRQDLCEEIDGPMLVHGLQEFHNRKLLVIPHSEDLRPGKLFLEERYRRFKASA